jgi:hypothetical protein
MVKQSKGALENVINERKIDMSTRQLQTQQFDACLLLREV